MNNFCDNNKPDWGHGQYYLKLSAWLVIVISTLFVGISLALNIFPQVQEVRQIAGGQARVYFNKDQAFHFWRASHGGVYVPIDENAPPNIIILCLL